MNILTKQCIYYMTLLFLSVVSAVKDDNPPGEKPTSKDPESELLDKEYGVKYANTCEVCKYLAIELEEQFNKLGQTHEVIETGYQLDGPKKRVKYTKSELYLLEAQEKVCDNLLNYNIHKERQDSTRFAKGMSSTFKTLHGLRDKGVKVELGIPEELWDSPSAEITALKQQCENDLEKYDSIIEQWYWGARDQTLQQYLCRERVLQKDQRGCLDDPPAPAVEDYVPKSKATSSDDESKTPSDPVPKVENNLINEEL